MSLESRLQSQYDDIQDRIDTVNTDIQTKQRRLIDIDSALADNRGDISLDDMLGHSDSLIAERSVLETDIESLTSNLRSLGRQRNSIQSMLNNLALQDRIMQYNVNRAELLGAIKAFNDSVELTQGLLEDALSLWEDVYSQHEGLNNSRRHYVQKMPCERLKVIELRSMELPKLEIINP